MSACFKRFGWGCAFFWMMGGFGVAVEWVGLGVGGGSGDFWLRYGKGLGFRLGL